MSRKGDYSDEMFTKRLSDEDVEAVLSGQAPDDAELAEIARVLSALDSERFADETGEKAAEFARRAAAMTRTGEHAKLAATARYRRGLSLTPRLAPAAVAAILLLTIMTGVAVASDSSVPGDALYGIDRAVEHLGIGNGGDAERIEEASVLTENGDGAEALDLLAETFDLESSEASDALMRASERIKENGAANAKVADLLEWMSTADSRDREFGQDVADQARDLGNGGQGSEDRGQSGEAPGLDNETPGQSGDQSQGSQDKDNPSPGQGGQGQGQGNKGSTSGQSQKP